MPKAGTHHLDRRAPDLIEASAGSPEDLLKTREVAEWLRVSTQFVEVGRSRGFGPPFLRLGPTRIRYRRADVLGWLEERTHVHTREYQAPSAERNGRITPRRRGVPRYRGREDE